MLAAIRPDFWDCDRIGASTPPIETEKGWLEIYHGVKFTSSGPLCRLDVLLLGLEDPTRVIGRSDIPVLAPRGVLRAYRRRQQRRLFLRSHLRGIHG